MEHFIESVRKYPCLWATNSEEYKINEIKDAAWRNVIKECDLPDIKEAKNLWKKLRDGHRQSLNRRKTTTGQAADSDKGWKYDKLMEFLIPYMANRPRTTNAEPLSEPLLEQSDSLQTQEIENAERNLEETASLPAEAPPNMVRMTHASAEFWLNQDGIRWTDDDYRTYTQIVQSLESKKDFNVALDLSHGFGSQSQLVQTLDWDVSRSTQCISRKRKSNDSLIKYLDEEKKARDKRAAERDQLRRQVLTRQEPPKDVMKSFFDTMYEMSKNLSENFQMKIQNEVFKSVMRAREENSKARVVYNISGAESFTLPPPAPRPGTSYSTHSSQPLHSVLSPESHIYHATSPPPRPGTSYSLQSSLSPHSVAESDILSPPCQSTPYENTTSSDGRDIRSYLTDDATYESF